VQGPDRVREADRAQGPDRAQLTLVPAFHSRRG